MSTLTQEQLTQLDREQEQIQDNLAELEKIGAQLKSIEMKMAKEGKLAPSRTPEKVYSEILALLDKDSFVEALKNER